MPSTSLIVDAVIGYSLDGSPGGVPLAMIEWAKSRDAPVVALDVPSGVDATTGLAPGAAVDAVATVTLALPKTGLDAISVGHLWLADIGIPPGIYQEVGIELTSPIFDEGFRVALSPA